RRRRVHEGKGGVGGHDGEHERGILNPVRDDTVLAHAAPRVVTHVGGNGTAAGLNTEGSGRGGGNANGTHAVGGMRHGDDARGDRGGRTPGGTARNVLRVPRVRHVPVRRVGGAEHAQLGHARRAEDD